jgi:hypothetical protein
LAASVVLPESSVTLPLLDEPDPDAPASFVALLLLSTLQAKTRATQPDANNKEDKALRITTDLSGKVETEAPNPKTNGERRERPIDEI